MSSPDAAVATADGSLDAAATALANRLAATETPDTISDEALARLLAAAVRLYAVRNERGIGTSPFGPDGHGVTATDVMVATTAMLQTLDLQLFELGMWQAWTGGRAHYPNEASSAG